jgi:hypothetical protein
MAFEKFNQSDADEVANRQRFSRPEDELDTPDSVDVKRRERAFSAEGGFQDLLRLKMVLDDLKWVGGLFKSADSNYIKHIINDPKTYAYAALGFDINRKDIPDDELQQALKKFLEESKISLSTQTDKYLPIIMEYESTTKSDALKGLRYMIENCKKFALNGEWESYCETATKTQAYFNGMEGLVNICCGSQRESPQTRKVVGAPEENLKG